MVIPPQDIQIQRLAGTGFNMSFGTWTNARVKNNAWILVTFNDNFGSPVSLKTTKLYCEMDITCVPFLLYCSPSLSSPYVHHNNHGSLLLG